VRVFIVHVHPEPTRFNGTTLTTAPVIWEPKRAPG